ncbi:MAG: thermonuclease family protein [Xanthomonadaceae bacterium]|nr:thermonuclease family protein [Xanthomonadaceae bacterium]
MRQRSLLLLLAALLPLAAAADQCFIVGVSDGDTLTARCGQFGAYKQIKVRLAGIDAPERKQPFGAKAKEAMSELVFGKMAELRCSKVDRYGRSVCSAWVAPASAPDGPQTLDAGLAMLTVGMAWWYRAYAGEQTPQERGQYEFAEFEAKTKKAGQWRDGDAVAPWEWRRQRARSE